MSSYAHLLIQVCHRNDWQSKSPRSTSKDGRTQHLHTIRQLKNIGVSIVLDDCGASHSSASFLTAFPFDNVKINKPFTQGVVGRRDCAAVVTSVVALARGLDVTTTAKGVETSGQFEALKAAGVDRVQGFLFGRPTPHVDLDFEAVRFLRVKDVA